MKPPVLSDAVPLWEVDDNTVLWDEETGQPVTFHGWDEFHNCWVLESDTRGLYGKTEDTHMRMVLTR